MLGIADDACPPAMLGCSAPEGEAMERREKLLLRDSWASFKLRDCSTQLPKSITKSITKRHFEQGGLAP